MLTIHTLSQPKEGKNQPKQLEKFKGKVKQYLNKAYTPNSNAPNKKTF